MLQDLSYLPGGFTMFLPVYCPFIAAVIVLMVIILIYTSIWSYKTRGEFLLASLAIRALYSIQYKLKEMTQQGCCDDRWHFADWWGRSGGVFMDCGGGGMICNGPQSPMCHHGVSFTSNNKGLYRSLNVQWTVWNLLLETDLYLLLWEKVLLTTDSYLIVLALWIMR